MLFEDTTSVRSTHEAVSLSSFALGPFKNGFGLGLNLSFCEIVLAMIFWNVNIGAHIIFNFGSGGEFSFLVLIRGKS